MDKVNASSTYVVKCTLIQIVIHIPSQRWFKIKKYLIKLSICYDWRYVYFFFYSQFLTVPDSGILAILVHCVVVIENQSKDFWAMKFFIFPHPSFQTLYPALVPRNMTQILEISGFLTVITTSLSLFMLIMEVTEKQILKFT